MRLISDVDWSELFERFSLVDELLGRQSRFAEMDFPTRNLYRSAIEELARGSGRDGARGRPRGAAGGHGGRPRRPPVSSAERLADPGYYLIAGGRPGFERGDRLSRAAVAPCLAASTARSASAAMSAPAPSSPRLFLAVPLVLAQAARAWARAGSRCWRPGRRAGGRPERRPDQPCGDPGVSRDPAAWLWRSRTASPPACARWSPSRRCSSRRPPSREQIERLEIHYLASPGGDLYFALLTRLDGFAEASTPTATTPCSPPRAKGRRAQSAARPRALPAIGSCCCTAGGSGAKASDRWIGWERKRGKLVELNRLLRGAERHDLHRPARRCRQARRYVITLDADTRLPRETVRAADRQDGPPAQPAASRSRSCAGSSRGMAILQPRVTPSLPIANEGSLFLRVFSSATGIDPYAAAVSDVYQDLFGEGSYTGKGIYDVDAFEAALAGRIPESAMLSHDLFEGIFARAGLASDVEVVEDFPARYDVAAQRHHRWARGDWQLLPWMLGPARTRPAIQAAGASPRSGAGRCWTTCAVRCRRRRWSPP